MTQAQKPLVGIAFDASLDRVDVKEILEIADNVAEILSARGYGVKKYGIKPPLRNFVRNLEDSGAEVIFNLVEGFCDKSFYEVCVAGIYEMLQIPYTGSDPLTLGLTLRKHIAKDVLGHNGVVVPKYDYVDSPDERPALKDMRFPMIVKPASEDGSFGISDASVVHNRKELEAVIADVYATLKQTLIIEEYIDGRELNVAIMGNNPPKVLPVSEIDFSTMPEGYHRIVSYKAKWDTDSVEYKCTVPKCPADIPASLEKRVKELALKAYRVVGCRDYARVDIRIDSDNNPFVLEINANPDLSTDAGFARSVRASGMTYEDCIEELVKMALLRRHEPV